jgi:hypothetical protein
VGPILGSPVGPTGPLKWYCLINVTHDADEIRIFAFIYRNNKIRIFFHLQITHSIIKEKGGGGVEEDFYKELL